MTNTSLPVDSFTIVTTLLSCGTATNEQVEDAFKALSSWFIANDGFRKPMMVLPYIVHREYEVLVDYISSPQKYPAVVNQPTPPDDLGPMVA